MRVRSLLVVAVPIILLFIVAALYYIPRLTLESDAAKVYKGLSQLSASQIDGYKGRNATRVQAQVFDRSPIPSLFDDSSDLHKGYKASGVKIPLSKFSQQLISLSGQSATENWEFTTTSTQHITVQLTKSGGKWQLTGQSFDSFLAKALPTPEYKKLLFIDGLEKTPAAEIVQSGFRMTYVSGEDTFYVQFTRAPVDAQRQAFLTFLQQRGLDPATLRLTYYLAKGL